MPQTSVLERETVVARKHGKVVLTIILIAARLPVEVIREINSEKNLAPFCFQNKKNGLLIELHPIPT